jgi:tetratricopeptide (TPR) repeat protein
MKKVLLIKFQISIIVAFFLCASCSSTHETVSSNTLTPNISEKSPKKPANETIHFLEQRLKQDPEDYIALNKLASEYLRQLRVTGDSVYLEMALRAAKTSLEILPAQQNKEGLAVLALAKYSSHEFAESRDYAKQLIELDPNKGYAYQILGDALVELGEYEQAEEAFKKMKSLGGIQVFTQAAMEQRVARLAWLKGKSNEAKDHYSTALKLFRSMPEPPSEATSYCSWQLGKMAFSAGDYTTAEKHYQEALEVFPEYAAALASMGEVRAALGDFTGAIEFYERAIKRFPDLTFIAALGDLYKITGRDEEANRQYELVEQIGRLSALNGTLYNRGLAMFYADHDLKTDEAYQKASNEYEIRRDIYGADALAWTALKAGKIDEAQERSKEALRLGTSDANLFYHAGMIANAAGDKSAARKFLQRALALNPKFSLLQAEICRKTLESLG